MSPLGFEPRRLADSFSVSPPPGHKPPVEGLPVDGPSATEQYLPGLVSGMGNVVIGSKGPASAAAFARDYAYWPQSLRVNSLVTPSGIGMFARPIVLSSRSRYQVATSMRMACKIFCGTCPAPKPAVKVTWTAL